MNLKRHPFNRLWFQFSAVIVGVVLVAAVTLIGVTYLMRPTPAPGTERATERAIERRSGEGNRLPYFLTRDAIILLLTGGVLALGGGVWMSRRMTRPLERLAAGATAVGRGDLAYRVEPSGSEELVTLAQTFNAMAGNLEEAERLRRHLLADVAHELRTPLTVLQGNLRAILDDVYTLDKAEVARLYDQTRHLHRLVSDLHELAQAEAHQLPLNFETTDANTLVQGTVELFEALAEAEDVRLEMALPDTPSLIVADRARITQALQNLLTNALRHTPAAGSILVSVSQVNDALGKQVCIAVQDTGEGIEAEHLPYVFDRFYRVNRARDRDSGGAGLGLALVRAFVNAHGGQVTVASPGKGRGSKFTILLPAAAVDLSLAELQQAPSSATGRLNAPAPANGEPADPLEGTLDSIYAASSPLES